MTATTGPAHGRAQVLRMTAFTDDPAGGNPAGVVLDASGLDDRTMLAIAADLGYSETAFVTPSQEPSDQCDGRVQARLRFFSPVAEVAFCGHAAIATAVALATRDEPGTIHFITRDCCSIRWHLTGLACGAGWEDGCHGQALPTGVPRGCRARRPQS